jgi:hypothetical protein
LLEKVCAGARSLLGSRYAVLAVEERTAVGGVFFATSGIDFGPEYPQPPQIHAGPLGKVMSGRLPWRTAGAAGDCVAVGLPDNYPSAAAVLAVPLVSPTRSYGWLCLADKIGAEGFEAEDERLLAVLGAQIGRIYEYDRLYVDVQRQATQLTTEIEQRACGAAELIESATHFRQLAEARLVHLSSICVVLNHQAARCLQRGGAAAAQRARVQHLAGARSHRNGSLGSCSCIRPPRLNG